MRRRKVGHLKRRMTDNSVPALRAHRRSQRTSRSVYLRILDCLRTNIVKLQFTEFAYGTSVSIVQARLIDEYVKRGAPRIEELALILGVHKSSISRNLGALVKGGFLKEEPYRGDSRRKRYSTTPKGERFIAQQRARNRAHYERNAAALQPEELKELVACCEVFAGDGPEIPILRVEGEEDLMIAIRRLAYRHGVVSGDYLGSGLSVFQFVLLSEIYHDRMDVVSLRQLLKTPHSTLTERLNTMVARGWVRSGQSPHDRRLRILSLTPAGRATLETVEQTAERVFRAALKGLSATKVRRFEDLLRLYVGPRARRSTASLAGELSSVEAARRELPALRRELLAFIQRSEGEYPLTGFLFSADSRVIKLSLQGTECCVCEVRATDDGRFVLVNYLGRCFESVMHGSTSVLSAFLSQAVHRPVDIEPRWKRLIENRTSLRELSPSKGDRVRCCTSHRTA